MRTRNRGFTLVEILVVITIIGILMSMLMAGVFGSMRVFRRMQCANNQQQIGKGIMTYESTFAFLPGYLNRVIPPRADPAKSPSMNVSWVVTLFPYVGRQDLHEIWKYGDDANYKIKRAVNIDFLRCAENPPALNGPADTPLAFVLNGGRWDFAFSNTNTTHPQLRKAYGPFFCRGHAGNSAVPAENITMRLSDVKDGPAQTLMISENVNAFYWTPGNAANSWPWTPSGYPNESTKTATNTARANLAFWWHSDDNNFLNKINRDPKQVNNERTYARPSSYHGGGVNVCFMDGHSHFLREEIDAQIYKHLCTPSSVDAGLTTNPPSEGQY